ncbi:outer membrane protein TolC [gut metagenome]|uniref:Outer membrane protein TolC n=1 Tax=gut metagenome TaxID=749906 RepID=J9G5U3_9ZZZZ
MCRKKTYTKVLVLSLLLAIGQPAAAGKQGVEDSTATPTAATTLPEEARTTTLAQIISQGLQNNFQIKISLNSERMAENNATRANAGYYPTINLSGGYNGQLQSSNTTLRHQEGTAKERNALNHGGRLGINAEWMIFDGFKIQTNYKRLQELRRQSATQTRITLENYVADLTAEYYNFVQEGIRMHNLRNAVALSKERLRIVQERYIIGSASRLELQQAQVDFNADSAKSLKQYERLATSRIRLNELMASEKVNEKIYVQDSVIELNKVLKVDKLWASTSRINAQLIKASQNKTLAQLDWESVKSRDYPYVKLNADYSYQYTENNRGSTDHRHNWGGNIGVTVGYKLFDGNRQRQRRNARLQMENAELEERDLELTLKADLEDLWQAYQNNLRLLNLERENLIAAKENHYIAHERYMLGDLSGIEMREAQQSLLDAEERILVAEYNTKLCEISLLQISGNIMDYAR